MRGGEKQNPKDKIPKPTKLQLYRQELLRKRSDPNWLEKVDHFITLFKESKDIDAALKLFRFAHPELGEYEVLEIGRFVQKKLGAIGNWELILREHLDIYDYMKQKQFQKIERGGLEEIEGMLKILREESKEVGIVKTTQNLNVNVDNSKNQIGQVNYANFKIGKDRLEDLLKKFPEAKREDIKAFVMGLREQGSLPKQITMKGKNLSDREIRERGFQSKLDVDLDNAINVTTIKED
jgi:hypothetical protein